MCIGVACPATAGGCCLAVCGGAQLSVEEFLKIWLLQEASSQGPVLACLPWAR